MPRRHSPRTLQRCAMLTLAKHWDLICYSAQSTKEMNALMESDEYLKFEGPFTDMPSVILEDLMEVIRSTRSLNRKFLHLLVKEQLLSLNLSLGIGEVYHGLTFLSRCKRLRDLNLSYLRHVEPGLLIKLIPHLTSIVHLNLMMTSTIDPVLDMISYYCPNLIELNLTSTMISDQGLLTLCGYEMEEKRCQKIQRLLITETRATYFGALTILQNLPNLTDFDFDKIFQVFEHLEPQVHPLLKLRSLYSIAPCVRGDSIDTAAARCPNAEILSVMNAWIDNETFYKFMQFEKLKSMTIMNSEGLTIDYEEGVLPILQVIGATLEHIILTKFACIDVVSLGRSCPNLRKMALSAIGKYLNPGHYNLDATKGLFPLLRNLELWFEETTEVSPPCAITQILGSSKLIENVLIKKANDFDSCTLSQILETNPMTKLSRLILIECNEVTLDMLQEFLCRENDLNVLRIWSCSRVQEVEKKALQRQIAENNLDVYLEWFT